MSESFDLAGRLRRPAARVSLNATAGGTIVATAEAEPLTRLSDAAEFREGYGKLKSGEWDAGKWQAFRLRFGLYGQLQPNVHRRGTHAKWCMHATAEDLANWVVEHHFVPLP